MKKCKCGSYAVNIERLTGENCDVCHYKGQAEALEAENAKLIAERDSFRKIASGMSDLLRAVSAIAGTEEYDDDFSVTIKALESLRTEREQWMKPKLFDEIEHIKNLDAQFNKFKSRVSYKLDNDSGIVEFAIDGKPTQSWALDDTSGVGEVFEDYLKILRLGWIYAQPLPAQQVPEGSLEQLKNLMCAGSCDINGNDTCCMPKVRELYKLLSAAPKPEDK